MAADLRPIAPLHERGPSRIVSSLVELVSARASSRLKKINSPRRRSWRRLRAQSQMRENALDHRRLFDPCPEPVERTAMIFNLPPHAWQCSISMSYTRLSKRAQLMRREQACVCPPSSNHACQANRIYQCNRSSQHLSVNNQQTLPGIEIKRAQPFAAGSNEPRYQIRTRISN